jgi:TfoX/Sxy family transcriptional regulator of competence genes
MAYDEDLANRVRELVGRESGLDEKRMFGGLALLVQGNMAVVVRGKGGLMVRVDPAESDRLQARPGVDAMVMRGRELRGWVTVDPSALAQDAALKEWVDRGFGYAKTLPAK